jgi:hypothetical protein
MKRRSRHVWCSLGLDDVAKCIHITGDALPLQSKHRWAPPSIIPLFFLFFWLYECWICWWIEAPLRIGEFHCRPGAPLIKFPSVLIRAGVNQSEKSCTTVEPGPTATCMCSETMAQSREWGFPFGFSLSQKLSSHPPKPTELCANKRPELFTRLPLKSFQ